MILLYIVLIAIALYILMAPNNQESFFNTVCGRPTKKTRTVTCRRSDGVVSADSFCSLPKPPTEDMSDCSPDYSACTYAWQTGPWSACT